MFQLARRGILRREEEGSRPDPLLARGRRRRSRQAHHHRRHAPDQRSKYRQDFIQELQLDSKGEGIAITWSIIFRGIHPPRYPRQQFITNLATQVDESSESESRYDRLLARVGAAISIHPELVKLVSYIVLFSADFTGVKNRYRVETIQVREMLS